MANIQANFHRPHNVRTDEVDTDRRRWPEAVHHAIEHETACAYADGYHQALTDLATRADHLDQTWRPTTRPTPDQVIADRLAALQPRERATWRTPEDFPGGLPHPPDYVTTLAEYRAWLHQAERNAA